MISKAEKEKMLKEFDSLSNEEKARFIKYSSEMFIKDMEYLQKALTDEHVRSVIEMEQKLKGTGPEVLVGRVRNNDLDVDEIERASHKFKMAVAKGADPETISPKTGEPYPGNMKRDEYYKQQEMKSKQQRVETVDVGSMVNASHVSSGSQCSEEGEQCKCSGECQSKSEMVSTTDYTIKTGVVAKSLLGLNVDIEKKGKGVAVANGFSKLLTSVAGSGTNIITAVEKDPSNVNKSIIKNAVINTGAYVLPMGITTATSTKRKDGSKKVRVKGLIFSTFMRSTRSACQSGLDKLMVIQYNNGEGPSRTLKLQRDIAGVVTDVAFNTVETLVCGAKPVKEAAPILINSQPIPGLNMAYRFGVQRVERAIMNAKPIEVKPISNIKYETQTVAKTVESN